MDPRSNEHEHEHDHRGRGGPFGGRRERGGRRGRGFGPDAQMGRGPRRGRGDVRTAALLLLLERPMHGYEMILEIRERSGEA